MINGYLQPFLEDEIFVALTRMIRHREGDLPAEVLHQIKTPCLLLWGDHDNSMPLKVGEKLNKDLVNSKLIVLKETGHALPEERPNEVYEYIKNFSGNFQIGGRLVSTWFPKLNKKPLSLSFRTASLVA